MKQLIFLILASTMVFILASVTLAEEYGSDSVPDEQKTVLSADAEGETDHTQYEDAGGAENPGQIIEDADAMPEEETPEAKTAALHGGTSDGDASEAGSSGDASVEPMQEKETAAPDEELPDEAASSEEPVDEASAEPVPADGSGKQSAADAAISLREGRAYEAARILRALVGLREGPDPTPGPGDDPIPDETADPDNLTAAQRDVLLGVQLGLGAAEHDRAATAQEFFAMLDEAVARVAPDKLGEWQQMLPDIRAYEGRLIRADGMVVIYYLARLLREEYISYGYNASIAPDFHLYHQLMEEQPHASLFPDDLFGEDPEPALFVPTEDGYEDEGSVINNARCYTGAEVFTPSFERFWDYDEEAQSYHAEDVLSYHDALLVCTRLIQIRERSLHYIDQEAEAENAEALQAVYAEANARRDAIVNAETTIVKYDVFIPGETYTGTAYYLSQNGDDANDGLSPETPKKNLMALKYGLEYGDAVFLERGSVWHGAVFCCRSGVTYSAYGEGPKPKLYGSPESGADPGKWELYYEDGTGKKIWKFYRDLPELGQIVFNDGERHSTRAYGWVSPNQFEHVRILGNTIVHSGYAAFNLGLYKELEMYGNLLYMDSEQYGEACGIVTLMRYAWDGVFLRCIPASAGIMQEYYGLDTVPYTLYLIQTEQSAQAPSVAVSEVYTTVQ